METLKRVLTVMVVTLVLIIVVGGLYTFGMGNMNHGQKTGMNMAANQNQSNETKQKQDTGNQNMNQSMAGDESKGSTGQQGTTMNQQKPSGNGQQDSMTNGQEGSSTQQATQDQSKDSNKGQQQNNQSPLPAVAPVVVQAPPAVQKTDPRVYVEQLKDKVKAIDDANSMIAANTGSQSMTVQQNGPVVSSGQSNMNELHQGFYKLGQNVSSVEQTLDNMSKDLQESNSGTPYYYVTPPANQYPGQSPVPYYPYGNPQGYQYNPYNPYMNSQTPGMTGQQPNQQGQYQNGQQQTQSGQSSDQMSNMNSNMQMNQSTPMSHGLTGLLNGNTLNLVFTLILIVSIILGIVAMVGFVSSLFKNNKHAVEGAQIQ